MNSCIFTGTYKRDPRGPKFKDGGPKNAGPDGWKFLHLSALDGKLTDKILQDFAKCIECPHCKRHFIQLIKDRPIPSDANADEQFEITVDLHNEVNMSRKVPTISLADARKIWGTKGGTVDNTVKSQSPEGGGLRLAIMITRA